MEERGARCPNCQLAFRVAASQLEAAAGKVRCGICLEIFDALANQVGIEQQPSPPAPAWARFGDDDHVIDDSFDPSLLEEEAADQPPVKSAEYSTEAPSHSFELSEAETLSRAPLAEENTLLTGGVLMESADNTGFLPTEPEPEPELEPEPVLERSLTGESSGTDPDEESIDYQSRAYEEIEATTKAIEQLEYDLFGNSDGPVKNGPASKQQGPGSDAGISEGYENPGAKGRKDDSELAEAGHGPGDYSLLGPFSESEKPETIGSDVEEAHPSGAEVSLPVGLAGNPDTFTRNTAASSQLEKLIVENQSTKRFGFLRSKLAPAAVLLLGLGALVTQWLFFQADQLSGRAGYDGLYATLCGVLPCQVDEWTDFSAIQTKNLVVRSHPRQKGALRVDATLVNLATRSQPFPRMILTFEDLQGAIIARRSFKPQEYLQGELAGVGKMPSRQAIHFILDILDPGEAAVSYTLIPE